MDYGIIISNLKGVREEAGAKAEAPTVRQLSTASLSMVPFGVSGVLISNSCAVLRI